jgi:hypothetical protein
LEFSDRFLYWSLVRVLVGWLVASGCYHPNAAGECVATCAHDIDCPDQLACGNDGLCRDQGAMDCRDRAGDAFPDVLVGDGAPVCFGGGTSVLQPAFCRTSFPLGLIVESFDTDDSCGTTGHEVFVQDGGTEVCIVYAVQITISGNAQITGSRPLVLAAARNITVSGGLSVATFRGGTRGAGASFSTCQALGGRQDMGAGGGGAPGGSFKGIGGNGATSATAMNTLASPPSRCPSSSAAVAPAAVAVRVQTARLAAAAIPAERST